MADHGNSNRITREYLDSLLIETRYMDAAVPDIRCTLFGQTFASPIMTAALSHLDHFMFPGAAEALARGAKEAGAILWWGMAEEEEVSRLAGYGAPMIEIIKPYADRELIYRRRLPVIIKGVLSLQDTERCLSAGAGGLVLSHHNNRIGYAVPPLAVLPAIAEKVNGCVPLFADCEIQTGMDAFKALSLGAAGVCIGRPLMTAIKEDPEHGGRDYLLRANRELKKAMAYTGRATLADMDPTVIHRL